MANLRKFTGSFAGGEMAPTMLGRLDDARMQQGAQTVSNFIVWPQGPASRRPGFSYVNTTKDSTKRSRLLPFSYGQGQGVAVEMGEGYFRMHAEGGTLLFIVPRQVASIDTATDRIAFTKPHGFTNDQQIRLFIDVGATVPTGLSVGATYFVRQVDAWTIEVALTSGGAAVNISGTGAGDAWFYSNSECPADYRNSRNVAANTTTDQINTGSAHNMATGDRITFSTPGGATLPTWTDGTVAGAGQALIAGRVYYAVVVDATNIRVATSAANAAANVYLNLDAVETGTPRVHLYYEAGDMVMYRGATPQGFYRCLITDPQDNLPIAAPTYWARLPYTGEIEASNSYVQADLFEVKYAQSGDVMTLCHQGYRPSELRRLSAVAWGFEPIVFGSPLSVPVGVTMTPTPGKTINVSSVTNASPAVITTANAHGLAADQTVLMTGVVGSITTDTIYVVRDVPLPTTFTIKTLNGGATVGSSSTTVTGGKFSVCLPSSELANYYRVTAVDGNNTETEGSASTGGVNNLNVPGSYNTVTWDAVPNAVRYNVYKALNGMYGYIGQTEELTFRDDNIAPDMAVTLPFREGSLFLFDYPGAVGYFEGRRSFGGSTNFPRGLWMSRVGQPADFSYHLPVQDDDRIFRELEAREAVTVRHIVPLQNLLLLTDSAEFRVSPVNSDAITPDSIVARPQSYVGGSDVQPVVVNGTAIFAANRGGHLRELGYRVDEGYITGDLSLRAPHLFDGFTIVDLAYQKAPRPILWVVRSDGALLGLTYTPEEGIGGWHQHSTDGTFESVCVVNDGGEEDSVYVIVKRTLDGTDYRFVERMAAQVQGLDPADWRFLDACVSFDGRVGVEDVSVTVARASTWAVGQSVTITSTGRAIFRTGSADQGDYVRAIYGGAAYRFRIATVTNGTTADGVILDAVPLPTATTSFAATSFGFMRDSITTPDHLDGVPLTAWVDGATGGTKTPSANTITLSTPALVAHFGLGYESRLQLLPVALQWEALAQGRMANIKQAWVRHWYSEPFRAGIDPDVPDDMALLSASSDDQYGLTRDLVFPGWDEQTTLWITQGNPVPLTVVSVTQEVSFGS